MTDHLTQTEREALRGFVRGASYAPMVNPKTGKAFGWDAQSSRLHETVTGLLTARLAQQAEDIAAAIEALESFGKSKDYLFGFAVMRKRAATIARSFGGQS